MIYRNKIERENRQQLHLTTDKRLRYASPLPAAGRQICLSANFFYPQMVRNEKISKE